MNQAKLKKLHGPGCVGCQANVGVHNNSGRKTVVMEREVAAWGRFAAQTESEVRRAKALERKAALELQLQAARSRRVVGVR